MINLKTLRLICKCQRHENLMPETTDFGERGKQLNTIPLIKCCEMIIDRLIQFDKA